MTNKQDSQKDPGYDEWLIAEVQEALDDTSPLIPHEEVIRMVREAIKSVPVKRAAT